jgi:hypothetical protein
VAPHNFNVHQAMLCRSNDEVRAQPVSSLGSRQIGPGFFAGEVPRTMRFCIARGSVDWALNFRF